MRPTVACDLDGCFAAFCEAFTSVALDLGITDRVWHEWQRTEWAFDFPVDPVWRAIDQDPKFWYRMGTLTDYNDYKALKLLAQDVNFMYVTARGGERLDEVGYWTSRWLRKYDFPEGPIFFVPGGSTKDEILLPNKSQLVAVIDDKPDILNGLKAHGIPAVARAWQYNGHVDVPRARTISEFVDIAWDNLRSHSWRRYW